MDLTPPAEVAAVAAKALEMRAEQPPSNRGGTPVGVKRANQLANRENLSPSTIRRMVSFFARHEVDKQATGFRKGEEGFPSKGRQAWDLWGGDPGKAWVEDQIAAMEDRALEDYLGEEDDMEEAVVATDIDDTIVRNGTQPIRETIDKINAIGLDVYVITGRDPSRRAETERLLDDIGLDWEELLMVGSQAAKRDAILALAAEYPIAYAFENDATVRGYYKEAGATSISAGSRRAQVEEILAELRAVRYSSK